MLLPLLVLGLGSIFSGYLLKDFFVGLGSTSLGNEVYILPQHAAVDSEYLPTFTKILPLVFSCFGAVCCLLINSFFSFLLK